LLTHLQPGTPRLPARTVIIGAGGFVGGAIARLITQRGGKVLAVSRKEVDLMAPDAAARLASLLEPGDAVVAAAANAPCKDVAMMIDNMTMVKSMVGALRMAEISHLVNISSDAVYADEPLPLSETSPTAPGSMHGAMHLAREIAFASEIRAPMVQLRPTLIYGAGDPHDGYGPNRFRRLAKAGQDIILFGEGEERRDHVLIDDVAELAVRVLSHRSQGVLNAATGTVHSFRSVAEQVVAISPTKVRISGSPRQGPMPHNGFRSFDPAAATMAFPDFVFTALEAGLKKAQTEGNG
jgi:nucleoside-diphosphate-sugar epimerase